MLGEKLLKVEELMQPDIDNLRELLDVTTRLQFEKTVLSGAKKEMKDANYIFLGAIMEQETGKAPSMAALDRRVESDLAASPAYQDICKQLQDVEIKLGEAMANLEVQRATIKLRAAYLGVMV